MIQLLINLKLVVSPVGYSFIPDVAGLVISWELTSDKIVVVKSLFLCSYFAEKCFSIGVLFEIEFELKIDQRFLRDYKFEGDDPLSKGGGN